MGMNNRQRRAAKARDRRRAHANRPRGAARSELSRSFAEPRAFGPGEQFVVGVYAHQVGDATTVERAVGLLAAGSRSTAAAEVGAALELQVAHTWSQGWQPVDLYRWATRELPKADATMLGRVIASEAESYADLGARVAPAWMAQVEDLRARHRRETTRSYLLDRATAWPDSLRVAMRVMAVLLRLRGLPRLTDPPGAWRDGVSVAGASLPDGVLDKVRALLAKAESTTFDAEADAFTAKAQELMARHRIDRALLESRGGCRDAPVGRRIGVADPYADAKALLLGCIADANGCRAVWSRPLASSTVFGFADELDGVEELFTSLLVQASAALRREGSKRDGHGRSRTTRFRRSFLVAFAVRIGHRLEETVDATVASASAETGVALVPVLAARRDATDAAAAAAFPEVGSFAAPATDAEGWYAGTLFGDHADLAVGAEHESQPA